MYCMTFLTNINILLFSVGSVTWLLKLLQLIQDHILMTCFLNVYYTLLAV